VAFFDQLGILSVTWGSVVMWLIALTLIYLAISKQYEPLLLLPIGFGILVANLPLTGLMTPGEGLIWRFYHYGVEWEIIPPLIFLGLGAHTDFGPLLSQPRLIFLGAAAQGGVYVTFFAAHPDKVCLEARLDQLIWYQPGKIIKPEDIPAFMKEGFEVFRLFA